MVPMSQEPWKSVADELARRAVNPVARRRPSHRPQPRRLRKPDLGSIRVLSERCAGDRGAVALTVDDATGERYLIIRELVRDQGVPSGWRMGGGSEGPDRVIPGKPDPYLAMSALATGGTFFAGGRVQSTSAEVARVRLMWDDGYLLEDEVQNGAVLFLGVGDSIDPATAEFLDTAGEVLGAHRTLIDEPEQPLSSHTPVRRGAGEFVWLSLNELTEVVSVRGAIVAVLYTVPAGSSSGDWLEFCWLPIDRPDQAGVLFRVAEQAGHTWINRWERARAAVESLLQPNETIS